MLYEEIPKMTQMQKLMLILSLQVTFNKMDAIFHQLNKNMKTNWSGIYLNCTKNVCMYEVEIVVLFAQTDYYDCPTALHCLQTMHESH